MTKRSKRSWSILLVMVMLFSLIGQGNVFMSAEAETLSAATASVTGDGYYIYEAEDYYSGNISEGVAADMQPGETLAVTLGTDFVAGNYTLTVNSCGNRESFEVLVNGDSVGTISRTGTDFGVDQMTADALETALKLEQGDVITIVTPADAYGWVDYLRLDVYTGLMVNEDYFIYQAEDYYSGNISEDAAADMQPNDTIAVTLNTNEHFAAGMYTLTVSSCGNRESFGILVNGENVGTISRAGTDFGMDQMTSDTLEVVLELNPEDVITIVAPDGGYYGWVDYLRLDVYTGPIINEDYFIYQAEDYYDGNISEDAAADMQPGETIAITLGSEFVAGKYTLTVSSCGNRETFEILVNGESFGTINRAGTGFGMDQMTSDKLEEKILQLNPEDVISIVAPADGYGWVDYLCLDAYGADDGTETGVGYFRYQAEAFYDKLPSSGDCAADMQPGETIAVTLGSEFVAGEYKLTVSSCGNRESFEILINGESVGTISRTGTNYGMDQMTLDTLETVLELKQGDVITVVAPEGGYYGWVDYLQLDEHLDESATETGDGYFVYQVEYYYNGNISEEIAADLQPGEVIEILLKTNEDFTAGKYTVTIYSCGTRENFEILVNGESVGTISRTATGYGQDQMTYDKLETVLELKPDDVVSIVAPAEGYGWVDFILFDIDAVAQVYTDGVAGQRYDVLQNAINAAANTGSDVKLLADSDEEISISNSLKLDLNGHSLTGKVTVAEGAALYGIDTSTDDFDCSDGYGKIVQLEGNYEPYFQNTDTKRYIATEEEDGSVSFHRFYMAINHKLLRPDNNGVGFKAIFAGDEVVKSNLETFGIKVCVNDDFAEDQTVMTGIFDIFTAGKKLADGTLTDTPNQKTVVIKNILKDEEGYDNAGSAVAEIHGRPYMVINGYEIIVETSTTTTLRDLINSANNSSTVASSVLMTIYNKLVVPFGDIMTGDEWQIDNILAIGAEGAGVITDIYTDMSRYAPGENATVTVQMYAQEDLELDIKINVTHLTESVFTTSVPVSLTAGESIEKTVELTLPTEDYQGYSVEAYLMQDGDTLDWEMTAVEVASDWSIFPRYGYLTKYGADVDVQATLERLNKYHITGLFYYDVLDRHEKPLAGTVDTPAESWYTLAMQEASKDTVSSLIDLGHEYNMNSYMYNLIFGAYEDYEESGVESDWGLFTDIFKTQQAYHGPLPDTWETQKLFLFNPANEDWQNHYLSVTKDVLAVYDYDGIQVDSLGDRGNLYTKGGSIFGIDLSEQYSPLLNLLTNELGTKVIFNPVSSYGMAEVMSNVDYDIAYEEIWPADAASYSDLKTEVESVRSSMNGSKKGIVIAAYMNYDMETGNSFNTPGILLTNATLMASGASHLELGDTGMLKSEYYPGDTLQIDGTLENTLRNYYSFMVAYENYLRDPSLVSGSNGTYINDVAAAQDSTVGQIWSFTKQSTSAGQVIHFINLIGANATDWVDASGTQTEPTKQENLSVRQYVDSAPTHVYLASPDHSDGIMTELSFEVGADANGTYITFQMPELEYWNMVILK